MGYFIIGVRCFINRGGILLFEKYENEGNLSFRSVKRPKRGLQSAF